MCSDIAIKVENLSKCYHIYDKPQHRLLQLLSRGRKQLGREFWALKDISFEIKKGETVGIIGRNGSGKSTLLQVICGILNPSSGTIETHGRIAALLELGSGFNPEFTGRENVYMNASVLGLTNQEIDLCFDDIIAFADIGDFIEQPVRTYSSGMMVRLAFAIQSQVSPDILIVDEALAVGDAKFQARCFERLKVLKENGTSILLVTHSSDQILTHCTHALLLENGQTLIQSEPRDVVNRYLDLLFCKEKISIEKPQIATVSEVTNLETINIYGLNTSADFFSKRPGYNAYEYRWGDGAAKILDFYLEANGESYPSNIAIGEVIKLKYSVYFEINLVMPILGVTVKTKDGLTVYGSNSEMQNVDELLLMGKVGTVILCEAILQCTLAQGDYFISLGVATRTEEEIIPHDRRFDAIHFHVRPCSTFFGLADLGLKLAVQEIVV